MTTPLDPAAIRALCEKATGLPWLTDAGDVYTPDEDAPRGYPKRVLIAIGFTTEDAEFCAAARTLLPACADEIERLRKAYVDVADALLPESSGPEDLAKETRRLRAALDQERAAHEEAVEVLSKRLADVEAERDRLYEESSTREPALRIMQQRAHEHYNRAAKLEAGLEQAQSDLKSACLGRDKERSRAAELSAALLRANERATKLACDKYEHEHAAANERARADAAEQRCKELERALDDVFRDTDPRLVRPKGGTDG